MSREAGYAIHHSWLLSDGFSQLVWTGLPYSDEYSQCP